MKRIAAACLCGILAITFSSCGQSPFEKRTMTPAEQLVGEWKMVQRIITSPNGAVLSDSDGSDLYMVKAFSENYYFFLISETATRKLQTAGGGRYTVEDGVIHQLTEHHSAEAMVGKPTEFRFTFEDGKLLFSGNAGVNLFQEVYVRLTGEGDFPYPKQQEGPNEKPSGPVG